MSDCDPDNFHKGCTGIAEMQWQELIIYHRDPESQRNLKNEVLCVSVLDNSLLGWAGLNSGPTQVLLVLTVLPLLVRDGSGRF